MLINKLARIYVLTIFAIMDFRLKHNSSLVCIGPSQSGKTTFVRRLLKYKNGEGIFDKKLGTVHWHYGTYFPDLDYMQTADGYKIYEGIPQSLEHIKPYDVVVLDDLMLDANQSKIVTELFTRTVHHLPCFLIMLMQNLYHQSKDGKTRQINTKYLVLFKNPRDQTQVATLARQMFPRHATYLLEVFEDATKDNYGYLFIDLHQDTPTNRRLRARILPEEAPQIIYQSVKKL